MRYAQAIMTRTKYVVRTYPEGPFPDALAKLRRAAGLTQEAAARLLGVTLSSVNKWERAEVTPQPMVQDTVVDRLRAAARPPKSSRKPRPT